MSDVHITKKKRYKRIIALTSVTIFSAIFILFLIGYNELKKYYVPTRYIYEGGIVVTNYPQIGRQISSPNHTALSSLFAVASQHAGFHVYYPTFIPEEVVFNRESLWMSSEEDEGESYSVSVVYELGDLNELSLPWVAIVEHKFELGENNYLISKINKFQQKQEVELNTGNGFIGITEARNNIFYHLIYTTNDDVTVWLRTKSFDFEDLIKIAQSMR